MNVKSLILASIIAIASIGGAVAADVNTPFPLDRPVQVEVVNAFDGPYWGIGGTTILDTNEYTPTLSVGANKRYNAVIVGGEVWGAVNVLNDGAPSIETLGFDVKAGFAVTNNVAVYAIGSVEVDPGTAVLKNAIGVGADVALNENLYVTGSYKRVTDFGTFDNPSDRVSIGLKFPF